MVPRPFLLPQELLEEIFQRLDIESILSLRVTCKTFYIATVSVWLYFAREIQSKPQSPKSEEPLEDYTPEELRDWVLRRHQAEQGWNAPSLTDIGVRTTKHVARHPTILPGGRWLLSMNSQDEIMVVDMNSPQLEPKLLVKVNRYIEGTEIEDCLEKFVVWVDPHALRLTFRVALINPNFRGYSSAEGRSRVCVFHAYLLGHGKGATLTAEPLRQFEEIFPGRPRLEALNGQYFIQVKEVLEGGFADAMKFDLYAFDCEKGLFTRVRLRGIEGPMFVDIFIPSNDKVAIINMQSVYVYAIPTPSATSGSEWHPIHTVSIGWAPPFACRSDPFTGKASTTIMCLRGEDLVGLEVPHDTAEEHSVTLIAAFSNASAKWRAVSLFNTLDYFAGPERCFLNFLRYSWDPNSDGSPHGIRTSRHEVDIPPNVLPWSLHFFSPHSFHSSIGRLVMVSRVDDLHIYDLVPVRGLGTTVDAREMK